VAVVLAACALPTSADYAPIWDNAPVNSSVQDCPQVPAGATLPRNFVYTLQALNSAGQMVTQ